MVDFAELRRKHYEGLDEEGRNRIDAYWAAEAEANETLEEIDAVFETFGRTSSDIMKREAKRIEVRIERKGEPGFQYEVIAFKKAVTGHETYKLDMDFVQFIKQAQLTDGGRFYICAGTPGKYEACSVLASNVFDYVKKVRPELLDEAALASKVL